MQNKYKKSIMMVVLILSILLTGCNRKSTDAGNNTPVNNPIQETQEIDTTNNIEKEKVISEYAYDNFNQNLEYTIPSVIEGKSILVIGKDIRVLVTLKDEIGKEFRVVNGSIPGATLSGFVNENENLIINDLVSPKNEVNIGLTIVRSVDEIYNLHISTVDSVDAHGEISRKGNLVIYEKENTKNTVFNLISDGVAIMQYEDTSKYYNDDMEHGKWLKVEMNKNGKSANIQRLFKDIIDIDILYNFDVANTDLSYTMDGQEVDTSKAYTAMGILNSIFNHYNMQIPDDFESIRILDNTMELKDKDNRYNIKFGKGKFEDADNVKKLGNGSEIFIEDADNNTVEITYETGVIEAMMNGINPNDGFIDTEPVYVKFSTLNSIAEGNKHNILDVFTDRFIQSYN